MYTIGFYISDHGFGHASRNIPIIRYILEAYKEIKIIVKTGEIQGKFMEVLLKDYKDRIDFYYEAMDVGLVLKKDSLEIHKEELGKKVDDYISSFKERIEKEIIFIENNNIKFLVSDIVPWVFKAAQDSKVRSLLITNFTWVEIYREHLSESLCKVYEDCYKLADKALFYELHMKDMKSYIGNYEEVSLISREFNLIEVKKIKERYKSPIVFISVGRSVNLTSKINVSKLKYTFIVTEGISLKGDNVVYLSKEVDNTQDYIMASDFIITKAGWGTVAEVLLAKKKCAVLARDKVAEDRNTVKNLEDMGLAIKVNYDKEIDIEEILKKLSKMSFKEENYDFKNDFKKIGDEIIEMNKTSS